jgi:hypothetical protein
MPQRVEGSIEIEVPVETVYGYWETGGTGDPEEVQQQPAAATAQSSAVTLLASGAAFLLIGAGGSSRSKR